MVTPPSDDRAGSFAPLDAKRAGQWDRFLAPERVFLPTYLGLILEEVRAGYARVRLPLRPEICQAAGLIHGGALAALIDTSAVPAVGTFYEEQPEMVTVSMTVDYCGAVRGQDALAEAWVRTGGGSLAFVAAEVRSTGGDLAATASLVFRVRPRPAR
ncbi:MAG: PaaI family thioesterase [Acidimicrobiales bacterium]